MGTIPSHHSANLKRIVASDAWQPWKPAAEDKWDLRKVVHLHHRAGFAGTVEEIYRDLKDGHERSIDRFIDGNAYVSGVPEDFESLAKQIGAAAVGSNNPNRLQAWWYFRMMFSPNPLSERLALMWHNHFSTSQDKVQNLPMLRKQNVLLRRLGRQQYGNLLLAVVKDAAMLKYLDADSNRASHPNENLARELLELFSVGTGNFDEDDVKDGARALTGWTIKGDEFYFSQNRHDSGNKTILGKTGPFNGDDFMELVIEHQATSTRIAWRICQMLMGENVVSPEQLQNLSEQFSKQKMNINWLLETILLSKLFFSNRNIGNRVRSGAEFIVATIRSISAHVAPPSSLVLSDWSKRMGHRLFFPPNVFGFASGREWITPAWLIVRKRFAHSLLKGQLHHRDISVLQTFKKQLGKFGLTPLHLRELFGYQSEGDQTNELIDSQVLSFLTAPRASLG